MRWCLAVFVASSMAAGCALERAPLETSIDGSRIDAAPGLDVGGADGGPDAEAIDVGVLDGGPDVGSFDAGSPDAGPPDAGPPDAGPPDDGPPDAGPPDVGPPDAGPVLRGCDAIYGTVRGYQRCAERPTECEFYMDPSPDGSCGAQCGARGGACIAARSEGSPMVCATDADLACGDAYDNEVCICTRIP